MQDSEWSQRFQVTSSTELKIHAAKAVFNFRWVSICSRQSGLPKASFAILAIAPVVQKPDRCAKPTLTFSIAQNHRQTWAIALAAASQPDPLRSATHKMV